MPLPVLLRRAYLGWLSFWFPAPAPYAQLALLRIGTALVLLFVLFVRTFDLDAQLSQVVWSDAETLAALDPIAWPFSVFRWVEGSGWLWSMHVLAIVLATAFLAGVLTQLSALLSLVLQLSYAHYNPAMLLGVDGLLIVALIYLSLVPSGRVLSVFNRFEPAPRVYPPHLAHLEEETADPAAATLPWSALPVRMLQLHLCVLYFNSALGKLTTDWLTGLPLWHPRLTALGAVIPLETLQTHLQVTSVITYGLVLFELFYPVLIWVPRLRYPLLGIALPVHLSVGLAWGLMPFNLLLLVLNLAFVKAEHLQALLHLARPLLVLPWRLIEPRD